MCSLSTLLGNPAGNDFLYNTFRGRSIADLITTPLHKALKQAWPTTSTLGHFCLPVVMVRISLLVSVLMLTA